MKRELLVSVRLVLIWILCEIAVATAAAIAAESSPVGWDKLVHAAKNEKELTIYGNVGYESIFSEFGKKYPEIKLSYVTGRGSADIVPRVLSEQRAEAGGIFGGGT